MIRKVRVLNCNKVISSSEESSRSIDSSSSMYEPYSLHWPTLFKFQYPRRRGSSSSLALWVIKLTKSCTSFALIFWLEFCTDMAKQSSESCSEGANSVGPFDGWKVVMCSHSSRSTSFQKRCFTVSVSDRYVRPLWEGLSALCSKMCFVLVRMIGIVECI